MFNCSRCSALLPPGALVCPQCGLHFEQPVPENVASGPPIAPFQVKVTRHSVNTKPGITSHILGFMMFAWWLVLAFLLMFAVFAGSTGSMVVFWLLLPLAGTTIWLQRRWQMVYKVIASTILVAAMLGFGIYSLSPSGKAAKIAEQQNQEALKQQEAEAQAIETAAAAKQTQKNVAAAPPVATQDMDTSVGTQSADEQQLKDLMKSRFGDHLRSVEVMPQHDGGYGIVVAFNAVNTLTTNTIVDSVKLDMTQAYDDLYTSSIDVRRVEISAYGPLQDKYGNQSLDVVYTTSMDKDVGKKINWDNWPSLDFDQLWTVDFANHSFINQ